MAQITYYCNSYDTGEPTWQSNPGNMVDGSLSTYAAITTDQVEYTQLIDGTSCDGTNLGNIIKVELRMYIGLGAGLGNPGYINITPKFDGGDGDIINEQTNVGDPNYTDYTEWTDITNSTNSPSTWTWDNIKDLSLLIAGYSGNFSICRCYIIELRVTYTGAEDYYTEGNSLRIYVSGTTSYIDSWCTRWDEGNWDVTIETFMSSGARNLLFNSVTPGAVTELMNILGTPYYIDSSYTDDNTLVLQPISGYGLSSLVETRTIGVKNISDTFISPNLFGIKIDGYLINDL